MRLFSRDTDIEVENLKIGRLRVHVRENFVDRVIGYFSPTALQRRLEARAALDGAPSSVAPSRRRMISRGYSPPPKMGSGPYGDGGGAFEQRVGWHQAVGASRGEAIRRAVDDDPEGHRRWLKSR